jgi:hypothetical protein
MKQPSLPAINSTRRPLSPAPDKLIPPAPVWSTGICPNCGYAKADIDPAGILWCPACGYSKKGCYT